MRYIEVSYECNDGVEISSCTGCWCPSSRQKCWEKQGVVPCCGAVVLWCCWCCWCGGADPVLKWCCCGEAAVATLSTASTAPLQVVSTRAHPGTYLSSCP